ncbi:Dabb family protein [Nocardia transvalensis]|uniref:Dabb family protein n=1 Tax=Nocardia transvalensis TaxID=37333 RepID=UPI0018958822|nr:Dabb family protein [Nocardia transvalensis]MBF6328461.1 Dabb family protein [Nocardia transvalensis]
MSSLRQVMLCTWKPDTTQEQIQLVGERLTQMPQLIPETQNIEFGPDAGIDAQPQWSTQAPPPNYDFAIVQDFADQQSYLAYRDHPAHQAIAEECFLPILAQAATIQFQLE